MAPKGKTPSLIGGGAGHTNFVEAKKLRHCKRCHGDIVKGTRCAEVNVPGTMYSKTYCMRCYEEILCQTKKDVACLEHEATAPAVAV